MKELDFTDLDTKTLMQNFIIHHREADRYAKDKSVAKGKLLRAETFEEFTEAKRRFELAESAQSAVITVRELLDAELHLRKLNIDKSITVQAFLALTKREWSEASASRKIARVTREAREIGVAKYKGENDTKRSDNNLHEARTISYSSRRAGKARFVAKKPLKEFFTIFGNGVRG